MRAYSALNLTTQIHPSAMNPRHPSDAPHDHDDARYPVRKTDAQWRDKLDPMQFQVARKAATERPFTGQ